MMKIRNINIHNPPHFPINLFDFAKLHEIEIECYEYEDGLVSFTFKNAGIKSGGVCSYERGQSETTDAPRVTKINEALMAYCRKIAGKYLLVDLPDFKVVLIKVPEDIQPGFMMVDDFD